MVRYYERYDDYGYERDDEGYEEQINEYLTPREVMELLAIGKNTFYKMVQSGQLPAFRIGRQWRVRRADIELWADGRKKARRKILCKRYSTKSRMALESRADSGLNPLFAESHGGQNGMRAGTA